MTPDQARDVLSDDTASNAARWEARQVMIAESKRITQEAVARDLAALANG